MSWQNQYNIVKLKNKIKKIIKNKNKMCYFQVYIEWINYTYIYPLAFRLFYLTLYWVEFTVLHRRFLSVTYFIYQFSSVQFSRSVMPDSIDPMNCSISGLPVHQNSRVYQTHVHWDGDAIKPSHPLSSPSSPAFNLSQHQGLFKWVSLCIRWPKYWSFSSNISPSNEHPGVISFRMD